MRIWCVLTVILAGSACAPARAPLPAVPPQKSVAELQVWQEPPPLGPEEQVKLGWRTLRFKLENGVGVNIISRPDTALTAVHLWVPSAADRSEGPVAVMGEALRAGTLQGTGATLVNPRLGGVPIQVSTSPNGTVFSWQVLARAAQPAIELLAAFVRRPVFEKIEVQIRLEEELARIQRRSGSTDHLTELARSAIPSFEVPSPEQDARALFSLNPDALKQLHGCKVQPEGAELIIVGPVDLEPASAWARAGFGDWKAEVALSGPDCQRWRPQPASSTDKRALDRPELRVVRGGKLDPTMVLVVPGPAEGSEDYLPFVLLSLVLEDRDVGSVQELRHMGATYGIHARVNDFFAHGTLLELGGQVEPGRAQAALRSLVEDIRGLSRTLTTGELDRVKRSGRNDIINSFSDNGVVASAVLSDLRRGRQLDLGARLDEWTQVELERCREVAQRWLDDAQPSIAVAGVPVKLVTGLGLGVRARELYWTDELQEHRKVRP